MVNVVNDNARDSVNEGNFIALVRKNSEMKHDWHKTLLIDSSVNTHQQSIVIGNPIKDTRIKFTPIATEGNFIYGFIDTVGVNQNKYKFCVCYDPKFVKSKIKEQNRKEGKNILQQLFGNNKIVDKDPLTTVKDETIMFMINYKTTSDDSASYLKISQDEYDVISNYMNILFKEIIANEKIPLLNFLIGSESIVEKLKDRAKIKTFKNALNLFVGTSQEKNKEQYYEKLIQEVDTAIKEERFMDVAIMQILFNKRVGTGDNLEYRGRFVTYLDEINALFYLPLVDTNNVSMYIKSVTAIKTKSMGHVGEKIRNNAEKYRNKMNDCQSKMDKKGLNIAMCFSKYNDNFSTKVNVPTEVEVITNKQYPVTNGEDISGNNNAGFEEDGFDEDN